jgi:hypothetical protein
VRRTISLPAADFRTLCFVHLEIVRVMFSAPLIITTLPILRGILTGLDRDQFSIGSCFDALVDRIATLFAYDSDQLFHAHLSRTNLDLVLNVEREIYPLPAHRKEHWQPHELPQLLASLPLHQPLGIYGRC